MASDSADTMPLDPETMFNTVQDYFDNHNLGFRLHPSILEEHRSEYIQGICDIWSAVRAAGIQRAHNLFASLIQMAGVLGTSDSALRRFLSACLTWCGIQLDLCVVQWVVEEGYITVNEILTAEDLRTSYGELPIHMAMRHKHEDVVDYLLNDWIREPLSILDSGSLYTPLRSTGKKILSFDSVQHFSAIAKDASRPRPQGQFPELGNVRYVWYFLRRVMRLFGLRSSHVETIFDVQPQGARKNASFVIPRMDLEDVLQALTQDNGFFTACLRAQDIPSLLLLWELYGHEPMLFHFMADWATSVDAHYFYSSTTLESHREDAEHEFLKAYIDAWSKSYHPKSVHTALFLERLQQDWNNMRYHWLSYGEPETTAVVQMGPRSDSSGMRTGWYGSTSFRDVATMPFTMGFRLFLQRLVPFVMERETAAAVAAMLPFATRTVATPVAAAPTVAVPPDNGSREASGTDHTEIPAKFLCNYVLAAAGSGKTQYLIKELSQQYGFYVTSGAIEHMRVQNDYGEEHYQPRTTGSSRDTELLFRTTQSPWLKGERGYMASPMFLGRCELLIVCRLELLLRIAELVEKKELGYVFSPSIWLQYQLTCQSKRDTFFNMLRVCLIAHVRSRSRGDSGAAMTQSTILGQDRLLWCFDEVQCDLLSLSDAVVAGADGSRTVLEALIRKLRDFSNESSQYGMSRTIGVTTFLSGTALNFSAVKEALRRTDEQAMQSAVEDVKSNFALVDTNDDFARVFDDRTTTLIDILVASDSRESFERNALKRSPVFIPASTQAFRSFDLFDNFQAYCNHARRSTTTAAGHIRSKLDEVKPKIVRNSLVFRGRHRWSVHYVECLLRTLFIKGSLTHQTIDEVTQEAQHALKAPLKERVAQLENRPDQASTLRDAFDLALDADLFGRSRILSSASSSELIERALGYVIEAKAAGVNAVKVCFRERLVVDSVMEHLRQSGRLESSILDYLHASQFHSGAFGDAAEVGLAVLPHREEFLSSFDHISKISTSSGCSIDQNIGLENFFLGPGTGLRSDYIPEGGDEIGLTKWLEQVLNEAPRPTFLFPEQTAGPDLMFVYAEKGGERRIVFAIQLKTGGVYASSKGVMNTIDPDCWFSTEPDLRSGLDPVLKMLDQDPTVQLLSVLLVAANEMTETDKLDTIIEYMEKRVLFSSTRKERLRRAIDHLQSMEEQCAHLPAVVSKLQAQIDQLKSTVENVDNESGTSRKKAADQLAKQERGLPTVKQKLATAQSAVAAAQQKVKDMTANLLLVQSPRPPQPWTRPSLDPSSCISGIITDPELDMKDLIAFISDYEVVAVPVDSERVAKSTDYYFQILTNESIEKVFGTVFARLLRGIKSRVPFLPH